MSALNYPNKEDELFKKFWPASIHLIGKDILRFHAVYWPAFLLAAKIDLPKRVYGHGWILSGEEKMSKSKGNILDPLEIIKEYGLDPLRYYLIKEVSFGNDASKSGKNSIRLPELSSINNKLNYNQIRAMADSRSLRHRFSDSKTSLYFLISLFKFFKAFFTSTCNCLSTTNTFASL